MKFSASDLYRAAMIGDRAKIEYLENSVPREAIVEIVGIDANHLYYRRAQSSEGMEIALKDIQSIERLGLSSENMADRVAEFLRAKDRVKRRKENGLSLWRRFGDKIEALKARLQTCPGFEALLAFVGNNSALSGDIKRQPMDEILSQLDLARDVLGEELSRFAEALIRLAMRDITGSMKAYLKDLSGRPDEDFIRKYAAQLAVISVQLGDRLSNETGFIFWIDELLSVDPQRVIQDEALWLNYLEKCVIFQHFKPLCDALRAIEDRKIAFEAVAYVMASNDKPIQACQALDVIEDAYGANYTIGQLLIQLVDDDRSYCVRYASRVRSLFDENLIGQETMGYIYDYVKLRNHSHIVNGWLVSYFVNTEKDISDTLKTYMDNCLAQGLDYEADLIHFEPKIGGVATNVER